MLKKINNQIDVTIQKLLEQNFHESEKYKELLAQTYYYVCHSEPLLDYAIENSDNLDFKQRSLEHKNEEHNHHLVAKNDLKKMGYDVEDFNELHSTKNLYDEQYKLIDKYGGEALLGYIYFLEALAVKAVPYFEKLIENQDKKTANFVKIHVEEDPTHVVKALEYIEKSEIKDVIFENIQRTFESYNLMLDEISASTSEVKISA